MKINRGRELFNFNFLFPPLRFQSVHRFDSIQSRWRNRWWFKMPTRALLLFSVYAAYASTVRLARCRFIPNFSVSFIKTLLFDLTSTNFIFIFFFFYFIIDLIAIMLCHLPSSSLPLAPFTPNCDHVSWCFALINQNTKTNYHKINQKPIKESSRRRKEKSRCEAMKLLRVVV